MKIKSTLLNLIGALAFTYMGCSTPTMRSESETQQKSLISFMKVDTSDGRLFYQEILNKNVDETKSSRIEYSKDTSHTKYILSIIKADEKGEFEIKIYDYNLDFKPDLVEWYKHIHTQDNNSIQTIALYRGPERLKHGRQHMLNALDKE